MFEFLRGLMAATALLCLGGCGTAIWSVSPNDVVREEIDGAVLSYGLAQGEVAFSADFKDGALALTTDQKIVASPDPKAIYHLVYNHNPFSDDDISIQMDGGLLKTVSSTTEDKTAAIIQNTTSLLNQITATRAALNPAATTMATVLADKGALPKCPEMHWSFVKNVTSNGARKSNTGRTPEKCEIEFQVEARQNQNAVFGVSGFKKQLAAEANPDVKCNYAICFRLGAIHTINAKARVLQDGKEATGWTYLPPFDVIAPINDILGYVRFDRRAFVKNKTEISFGANGLVSGFSATNPSEVVGFLIVPTAVLAGVVAAAALR